MNFNKIQYAGPDNRLWELLCGRGRLKTSSFADYSYYDAEDGIYHMKDGSMGFILEIYPVLGMNEPGLKALKDIYSLDLLRENDSMQVINFATDFIDPYLTSYISKKNTGNELLKKYCINNMRTIFTAKDAGYKGGFPDTYTPKDFRVVFTFRTGGSKIRNILNPDKFTGFFKAFSGLSEKKEIEKDYNSERERILRISKECSNLLMQAGTFCSDFGPENLKWHIDSLFGNYGYSNPFPADISEQIFNSEMYIDLRNAGYIKTNGTEISVLTVKDYPSLIYPSDTSNLLGSHISDRNQVPANTVSCLNLRILSQSSLKEIIQKKKAKYNIMKRLKKAGEKLNELETMEKNINEGNYIHEGYLSFFAIRNSSKRYELEDSSRKLISQIEGAGYLAQRETFLKCPLFINSFPLNFNVRNLDFFERKRHLSAWNCTSIAPYYGDIKGNTIKPSVFFMTRRSQLYSFDIFDENSNDYAMLIFGPPGTGKSFLIQTMAANYLAEDAIAVITEVGHSYENSTRLLGGRYVDFNDSGNDISFNPFLNLEDNSISKEELLNFTNIFQFMASPRKPMDEDKIGYLSTAVKAVAEKYGPDGTVELVMAELKGNGHNDLSDKLFNYSLEGIYGDLCGPSKKGLSLDADLTAIALPPVEKIGETLLTFEYMVIFSKISSIVYSKKFYKRKKFIAYDEYHNVKDNPYLSPMISKQFRQYRKCFASVVIGTQTLEDVHCNEYSKVLADSASYQVIFQQKPATIDRLKNEHKLNLTNDAIEKLFRSIGGVKGLYSEFMLMTPRGNTLLRHIATPFEKALFGSEAKEVMRIKDMENAGMSLAQAVEKISGE